MWDIALAYISSVSPASEKNDGPVCSDEGLTLETLFFKTCLTVGCNCMKDDVITYFI